MSALIEINSNEWKLWMAAVSTGVRGATFLRTAEQIEAFCHDYANNHQIPIPQPTSAAIAITLVHRHGGGVSQSFYEHFSRLLAQYRETYLTGSSIVGVVAFVNMQRVFVGYTNLRGIAAQRVLPDQTPPREVRSDNVLDPRRYDHLFLSSPAQAVLRTQRRPRQDVVITEVDTDGVERIVRGREAAEVTGFSLEEQARMGEFSMHEDDDLLRLNKRTSKRYVRTLAVEELPKIYSRLRRLWLNNGGDLSKPPQLIKELAETLGMGTTDEPAKPKAATRKAKPKVVPPPPKRILKL